MRGSSDGGWRTAAAWLCGGAAGALLAGAAHAQDGAATELGEVIVTAQKRSENLQDVPISIAAFSQAQIEQMSATTLQNIEGATPGLSFGNGGRASRGEIGIRGVSDYARNIGIDGRAGVYIDGVYQGRSYASDPDLLGVERIEVLRGPQGALFGRNTVAGAINITTRKPADRFEGELTAEAGNDDYRRIAARIDAPLGEGAALAVSGARTRRDGYIRNITLDKDLNGADRSALRAALRLTPTDALEVLIAGDYFHEKIDAEAEQATAGPGFTLAPGPFEVAHNEDGSDRREMKGVSATVNYTLPNAYLVTLISAYREAAFRTLGIEEDYTPLFIGVSDYDESSTQTSHELRLTSPQGRRYDLVAGLYYISQDLSTRRQARTGPAFVVPNSFVVAPGAVDVEAVAAFANATWRVTDAVELAGGLRWTHERKKLVYSITDTTTFFTNFQNFRDTLSDTDLSPRVGVNVRLSDQVMVYANAARAFKSGGWNADFISTLNQIQYQSEQATNHEVGLKATFWDRRLRLNLAAFQTKYDDFQVFQFLVNPANGRTYTTITNAGEVTTKGFEAELVVRPVAGLTLTGTGAYTDARFDRFADGGGPGVDFDGNRLAYAPKWKLYASAEYRRRVDGLGELVAFVDYGYTADQFSDPNNSPASRVDSYELVNARLSLLTHEDRVEAALWARNLLDETYFRSRTRSFLGFNRGVVGAPRAYGVSLKYSF